MRRRHVSERRIVLIEYIPIDVGLVLSQPMLSDGGRVVSASASLKCACLEEFCDSAIEGAFGDLGRESGQCGLSLGTMAKNHSIHTAAPKRAWSSLAPRLGPGHGSILRGHREGGCRYGG